MKKIYITLLSSLFIGQLAKAQVTLTKAFNEPVVGDVNHYKGYDSLTTGAIPKNGGTGVSWNFSAFTQNTVVANSTFTTPASVPSSSNYPGTTIVEDQGNNSYGFYKAALTPTTSFELVGLNSSNPNLALTFTNSAIVAIWPMSYGYTNTDLFSGNLTSPISGTFNGTVTTSAAGTGTLTIPGGTQFTNVLQMKAVNTLTLSGSFGVTGTVTQTFYQYYSTSQKFPVLTVTYLNQNLTSPFGPTVSASYSIRTNTLPAQDAGVVALLSPTTTNCFSSSEKAVVTITNSGTAPASNFSVTVRMSGAGTATLNGIYSATLAPNASASYTLPGTLNMSNAGTYSFKCFTSLSGDGNLTNDTITATRNFSMSVSVVSSNTMLCNGSTATLTANGANSYTWSTGATTSVIAVSPTINSTYTVTGANALGCQKISTITQSVTTCTGIENNSTSDNSIMIFPNPNNGEFNINLAGNGFAKTIEISDLTGRIILSESTSKDKMNINISSFPKGIYIVKTNLGNKTSVQRLIVE